jgi:isocitrate lyase
MYWEKTLFTPEMSGDTSTLTSRNLYPETHLLHPKNQCMKAHKRLDRIEAFFQQNQIQEPAIVQYIQYVYGLAFAETPNYEYLLSTIADAILGAGGEGPHGSLSR